MRTHRLEAGARHARMTRAAGLARARRPHRPRHARVPTNPARISSTALLWLSRLLSEFPSAPEVSVSFPCRARSTLLPRHAMSDDSFGRIHVAGRPQPPPRRGARGEARRSGHHAQGQRGRVPKRPALRSVAETIAVAIEELRDAGKSPKVIVVARAVSATSTPRRTASRAGAGRSGAGPGERQPDWRLGIAKTRDAVRRLNLAGGFPRSSTRARSAVGVSPYGVVDAARRREDPRLRNLASRAKAAATQTLDAGLVPVLTRRRVLRRGHGLRRLVRRRRRARALRLVPPEARGVRDGRPGDVTSPRRSRARARGEGERGAPKRGRTDAALTLDPRGARRRAPRERRQGRPVARLARREGGVRARRRRRRVLRRRDFGAGRGAHVAGKRRSRRRRGGRDRGHSPGKDARGGKRRVARRRRVRLQSDFPKKGR